MWLPTTQPPVNGTRATYWASIAQIVGSSNLAHPGIGVRRSLPPGRAAAPGPTWPPSWQPALSRSSSADAALKGST